MHLSLVQELGSFDMKQAIMNFLREEEGLTTVEYAVAGGLITVAAVAAFAALGSEVARVINDLVTVLQGVQPG
jgi:pilus assembly protein Flp/PilA